MWGTSFLLFRFVGIPVRVHWTFFFFLIWVAYSGHRLGLQEQGIFRLCVFMLLLFICVILHEFGHAFMARHYAIPTKDIIISPLGGIARLLKIPDKPAQEMLIALAGPAVNLTIAIFLLGFLWASDRSLLPVGHPHFIFNKASNFLPTLFLMNAALVVFNLIPAFPMDGGRILRSVLSWKWGRLKATRWSAIIGQVLALGLLIAAIYFSDFILGLIAAFVFFAAGSEFQMVMIDHLTSTSKANDFLETDFPKVKFPANWDQIFALHVQYPDADLPVSNEKDEYLGLLSSEKISEIISSTAEKPGPELCLQDVQIEQHPETSLQEIIPVLRKTRFSLLPLTQDKILLGVIKRKTLNDYLRQNTSIWQQWKTK